MAAVVVVATSIGSSLNITDATFTTLVLGAGEGIKFLHDSGGTILLKNATGGSVNYTFKMPAIAALTALSLTTPDYVIAVANNKTVMVPMSSSFRASDGYITIECSAAAQALILKA